MIALLWCSIAWGVTLEGRLVDAETGNAIAGASVEAWDPRLRGYAANTDTTGWFSLELESEGPWRIRAVPRYDDRHVWRMADGTADFCASEPVRLTTDLDYGDIALPTGRSVTGQVVDDAGLPVPGATVWVIPADNTVNFDRPALTNTDGAFEVVGLDTDTVGTDWKLQVAAEGWPDQYYGPVYEKEDSETLSLTSESTDVGTTELLAGITVGGMVYGPDGPVDSGTVSAYSSSQVVTVVVDSTGRYEATGLPPGDVITWANSPGLAQTYYPDLDRPTESEPVLAEGAVRDDLDLTLPAQAIFEFSFVDSETGDSIAGIGGLLYNDTKTVGLGNSADDAGILRIDRLHEGSWTLYAWGADEGYADGWVLDESGEDAIFTIEEAEEKEVEVPMALSARIAGKVVDEDGNPVDGIAIAALREDYSGLATTTEPDGTFVLGGMGAGTWTLTAEYDAICPGDPGFVPMFWPGTPNRDWSRPLVLASGEQRIDIIFKVPKDADLDEMADAWERAHGLDPTTDTDARDDPDGDTYTNLEEYRMGTDPFDGTPVVEECGCHSTPSGGRSLLWLLLTPAALVRRRR